MASVLAMLCLAGCGATVPIRADLPLAATSCHECFPFPWEIKAAISVQTDSAAAHLLVALATTASSAELALLTPQGIPLYRFTCLRDEWEIRRQARSDLPVEPERLVAWLQLIYLDETRIPNYLSPGWEWSDSGSVRQYFQPNTGKGTPPSIHIERTGSGPWYATARLEESGLKAQLIVRTLEAIRVLPE